jgi:hypothetical protein
VTNDCPAVITIVDTTHETITIELPSDTIKPPPVTLVHTDKLWRPFTEREELDWSWLTRTRVWTRDPETDELIPDTLVGLGIYYRPPTLVQSHCWYATRPGVFAHLGCDTVFTVQRLPGEEIWDVEGPCETLRTYWGHPDYGPNMERPPVDEWPGDAWWCNYDILPYSFSFRYMRLEESIGEITVEGFTEDGERIMRWTDQW